MSNTIKYIIVAIVALVIGFVGGVYGSHQSSNALGAVSYDAQHFAGDVYQGMSDVKVFSNGIFLGTTQVGGGTLVSKYSCATATWNPPAIGPYASATSTTSTVITLAGAVMGDICTGSLTSATSSAADIACDISGAASATLQLYNDSASVLDLATGTAKVCYTH